GSDSQKYCPVVYEKYEITDFPQKIGSFAKVSSRQYYDKKRAEGKKHNQAIRALGRHLVRVIWSMTKQGRKYEIR
ncbi:hypothetical protein SAMN05421755_105123, partial [Nitrosomonas sp. Nm33]